VALTVSYSSARHQGRCCRVGLQEMTKRLQGRPVSNNSTTSSSYGISSIGSSSQGLRYVAILFLLRRIAVEAVGACPVQGSAFINSEAAAVVHHTA
jgi:hypothetical protein